MKSQTVMRRVMVVVAMFPIFIMRGADKGNCEALEWGLSAIANAGWGSTIPHYITALRQGRVTQRNGTVAGAEVIRQVEKEKRFSWGAGAEVDFSMASSSIYDHWQPDGSMVYNKLHVPAAWIQQLYGEVKWRSLFFEAGMRDRGSALLNDTLTSGDIVQSGNARSIPQLRAGFVDFQDVPLTGGWLQVQGELAYGKYVDNGWMKRFYSYGSYHLNTGAYYVYRRLYFRSNPDKKLSVTLGMQAAGEIGGITRYYKRGELTQTRDLKPTLWEMVKMIAPMGGAKSGVGEYMDGNNLGSWDVMALYRLPWDGDMVKCYMEKPWEKGSSIGWKNGLDALWGIEYRWGDRTGIVTGAVVEYIDFMNQSGAVHFAPHDRPGTTITTNSIGGDQYYNNSEYNSYANYGMGMGTPFLVSPRFNGDGYPAYVHNRVRGFHAAVTGRFCGTWGYRAAVSYKKGYGDGRQPIAAEGRDTSWLAEVSRSVGKLQGLTITAQVAMDCGNMPGNNFGMSVSAVYRGNIKLRP